MTTVQPNLSISVTHNQRGQAGNYQPHVYESVLVFESKSKYELPREWRVKQIAQVLVHSFTEEPSDGTMNSYYRPRLTKCEQIEDAENSSSWIVRVEEPYTD